MRDQSPSWSSHPQVDWTPLSPPVKRSRAHHYGDVSSHADSDDDSWPQRQGLRIKELKALARDIERFNPSSLDANIDNYLREVERCLMDLPYASPREKLKLLWKTTARSVHVFMETLPADVRDSYAALCQALREEYSTYTDETSATLGALSVTQKGNEPPREYYMRLRAAYFQGRSAPVFEEDKSFKSLFLHNLHDSVRYDVTMHCRTRKLTMQEIRRYAQLSWETRMRPTRGHDSDVRVLGIQASGNAAELALEGSEMPRAKATSRARPQVRRHTRPQGKRQNQGGSNQTFPHEHGKPRRQGTFQPKGKVRFEKKPNQGNLEGKWRGKDTTTSIGDELKQEMEVLLWRCLSDAVRKFDEAQRPSGSLDHLSKPDISPLSA